MYVSEDDETTDNSMDIGVSHAQLGTLESSHLEHNANKMVQDPCNSSLVLTTISRTDNKLRLTQAHGKL